MNPKSSPPDPYASAALSPAVHRLFWIGHGLGALGAILVAWLPVETLIDQILYEDF